MIQSGHLNPSGETGTGFPVTSTYGRTPLNKHGCVSQQHNVSAYFAFCVVKHVRFCSSHINACITM